MNSVSHTAVATEHLQAVSSPSYQAYQVLHFGFTLAPLLAGADKFTQWLTNWDQYLAPQVLNAIRGTITPHQFMQIVGGIEILAALLVLIKPRIGAYVVCLWLVGIIVNLLMLGHFYDIALRDFGLALGAFALGRLSEEYSS